MDFTSLRAELDARNDTTCGGGVSATVIAQSEEALGLSFPAQLKEYLALVGTLDIGHFELFGLGEDTAPYRDLVKITVAERTGAGRPIPGDVIPLLNDGAGNLVCMAAAGSRSGRMVFWAHSGPPDEPAEHLYGSMIEWLQALVREIDEDSG